MNVTKIMIKRQLFHEKKYVKYQQMNMLKWSYGLFGQNYRSAIDLSTLYLTVIGIIMPSLKEQF